MIENSKKPKGGKYYSTHSHFTHFLTSSLILSSMAGNNNNNNNKEPKFRFSISTPSPSELAEINENSVKLTPDEYFKEMKKNMFDTILANPVDGIFRNLIRGTVPSWTSQFGVLPPLIGKNWLWLQVFLTDKDRVIQGKFYGLGAKVSMAEDHTNIVQRSRNLFREAVPFLLQGGGADHWVFSRSKFVSGYNCRVDGASEFAEYDPLNALLALPVDIPSGVRCTEAFLILAGDFEVRGDGFSTREAVLDLLQELSSTEGHKKLLGFAVCCASVQMSREKLNELKNVHMTA